MNCAVSLNSRISRRTRCLACSRWGTNPASSSARCCPTRKKSRSSRCMKRTSRSLNWRGFPNTDVFEGVTKLAKAVYAYDLVITDHQGKTRRTRDAYSFLPTLGEADLFLFGKGDERKIYDKLGAQLRSIDGVHGTSFAVWAPNAQRVSVVGDFNNWDGRVSFHAIARRVGRLGNFHSRRGAGRALQIRDPRRARPHQTEHRSVRFFLRGCAQAGGDRLGHQKIQMERRRMAEKTPRTRPAAFADEHL